MLKLKKIELLGFKSFADRTEILFNDSGVAAIVGPNGCGKSNISDAITWVLGEQSAKNLRSGRMQDVIFNGTPGRKATGLAEVHLTLLDAEGEATLPFDRKPAENGSSAPEKSGKAPAEITVSRRLFQSGESEYLLNGRPCRLRDVQDIFLGTGLGPEAYAVIEQGRIGQILSSKPYELRAIVEEAAGVTKFKAKRKLAWAKLESSKQNLSRVNDILEEISRQLNSLKRQASRAQRYTELRDQMRAQFRIVLASNYREREQQAVGIAMELGTLNRSLEEQTARTESQEAEQHEMREVFEREGAELRRSADERSSLRVAAERARSQTASQTQQIGYLAARMEEAAAEISRLQAQLESLENERRSCEAFISEIEAELSQLAEQLKAAETEFHGCQDHLKSRERKLTELRQDMLHTVGQCATLSNQVAQLQQFLNATQHQMERAEGQLQSATAEREQALLRSKEVDAGMRRQREELAAIVANRKSLEDSLRTGKAETLRRRAELEEIRADLSAQQGRLASLQEILARRAYSTETVKRLFEAHASRKNGFHAEAHDGHNGASQNGHGAFHPAGILADFVEVDAAYEYTVEEFLRDELDYIVVKDWSAAKEGVNLLRTAVPGRATFLLHSAIAAGESTDNASASKAEIMSTPGVLGSLADRIRLTNGFSHVAGNLLPKLRGCYLVADVDTAEALSRQHPECYFLTPEGDWFHGSLLTAGKGDNTGPLALKRELRELTSVVASREQEASRASEELARLNESLDRQQNSLQQLMEEQQQAEKRMVVAERDSKEAAEQSDRLARQVETIRLEIERLHHEAERSRQRLDADSQQIKLGEQRRHEIETEIASISGAMAEIETAREEAHRKASEIRSRLAALEERRRASAEALARMDRGIRETNDRASALRGQCEDWNRQKVNFEGSNLRLEEEAAAAERRCEELALKVAELEKSYEIRRSRLAEMEQELHVQRRALEEAREKKSAAEVQMARLESELGHLKESCRNELQVEIESLAGEQATALGPEELTAAEESYRQIKAKIEGLGPINMMALEEYEECRQRHDFLQIQRQDLLDSIRDTTQAIEEIDDVSQKQFAEAFEHINTNFQEMFQHLFGGGQGMLRLTEAENPADRGVEIIAQPPGKKLQSVLLLSGGEKALTAIGLLLATFRYKPSPFCVLDEVDAPLDEANVGRFARMVQEMSRNTQFILITHSKRTMSVAPVLYGVTMEEPGVSKIVSVKFNGAASTATPQRELAEAAV